MSIKQVVEGVSKFDCPLVEVTGGEPLEQKDTPKLITTLLDQNYEVLLETNGSHDIEKVDNRCVKIVDIKCPSSGESTSNNLENLKKLTDHDEVKFVIGSKEDFDYAKSLLDVQEKNLSAKNSIYFSPVFGRIEPSELAQWILDKKLDVRMQLQLHKIVWNPDQRGV